MILLTLQHKRSRMTKNISSKNPLSHLIHVGAVVKDMEEAKKRLSILGIGPFQAQRSLPPVSDKPLFRGKPADFQIKDGRADIGEVVFDLIEPVKGKSPWQEFLDQKGEGIHHMAFHVDNIDSALDILTRQGVKVLFRGKWEGGAGVLIDIGLPGVAIELLEGAYL
jgi:methylmalonyl-CoA/ethylmalonyl-CoA epimerase